MDEFYMRMALELARKGKGWTAPNPLVGAVIVKAGRVIGQGYHEEYGQPHAEVKAIASASECVSGATLYVTLEPCSHFGKTPPCSDLLIEKNIKRVVIGITDPNPLVAGKGIERLRNNGIEVITGVLEVEIQQLNEVFIKYIVTKEPFVVMKSAMSLDGKTATVTGESQWISSRTAREQVHGLRHELAGIMVGIETIIRDNPQLTSRTPNSKNPIRIVVDSQLRIPMVSTVLHYQDKAKTIIATTKRASREKLKTLKKMGIEVIVTKEQFGRVNLRELMRRLGARGIDSILLEGGATLNFSALKEGIVDKVQVYISPKIIGGKNAKTAVEGEGVLSLKSAFQIKRLKTVMVGEDLFVEGYIDK
ncbi:bifunctional diaminohydroxyphosphoribosylaminopyrimidine deaminase/5-amino-6-(5-phosphoribosylamino)uracil reductase RibD [Carnobacterium funditum]|uniref:bifunctional diaminohydroxyphosphoribosylaminopyrimidine deaminase/5-amino-6-(5-phosphoribosylamino)uracil reductase RibD n=1 Tax=Carnobacterium funditum TaxID=2752 RepID=UPI0005560BC4|nr:bifunctional diaminohydroxyphosphoribosylaminopyrimidine deaminase/5-amino-6-(5-phosphoribosylamino)uracil reductase RibD [Carnobacterium funditum]